jgi:hypothetical protein
LAGFCVAGISVLNSQPKVQQGSAIADDGLALAAVLFLICTYLIFWALRASEASRLFKI